NLPWVRDDVLLDLLNEAQVTLDELGLVLRRQRLAVDALVLHGDLARIRVLNTFASPVAGLSFMVLTVPGPPSPSTSRASITPAHALSRMVVSPPARATFQSRSADTATGHSSVTLQATIFLPLTRQPVTTSFYWSVKPCQ
ncbi:unnamed protein product, partial [Urochloa humidicola]